MNVLPKDLKNIIFLFLPKLDIVNLNKNYYLEYNDIINLQKNNRYICYIIRKDLDFIFNLILQKKKYTWLYNFKKNRSFDYSKIKYNSFLEFMLDFSLYHNSIKCNRLLNKLITEDIEIKWSKRKLINNLN